MTAYFLTMYACFLRSLAQLRDAAVALATSFAVHDFCCWNRCVCGSLLLLLLLSAAPYSLLFFAADVFASVFWPFLFLLS